MQRNAFLVLFVVQFFVCILLYDLSHSSTAINLAEIKRKLRQLIYISNPEKSFILLSKSGWLFVLWNVRP